MGVLVKIKKYLGVMFGSIILIIGSYFIYSLLYQRKNQVQLTEIIFDEKDISHGPLLENFHDHGVSFDKTLDSPDHQNEALIVEDVLAETSQHLFSQLPTKIFFTPEERLNFFKELGIDYCNDTVVEYEPLLVYDIKKSEKYLHNKSEHDLLTELYDDDLVLKTLMPMSIRWISPEVGHGVFAEDDLPAGGFVGIYGGVVKDREFVDDKDYAWAYPEDTLEGGRITLDAKYKGNELRLINDGKDPNCIVKYILGSDGLWHVCYLALKDIKKGDQLLVSYGSAYWDTRKYGYQELTDIQ